MTSIWSSSDLFELMERLELIERSGGRFDIRQGFTDFVEGQDSQKVNQYVTELIKEGGFPEPTKEMRRVYFFTVLVRLWDSSLTYEEYEAAALFLSTYSWAMERGLLPPVLKEGGK